ncbi:MAG: CinA family nicotinamide mononucleotide deamidase-related protein, partial [Flavicella sp.]|nr:CinA family nicotinamide mononucleotide deamidase-related protein [Flavicella sp.]
ILEALKLAEKNADIVLLTGGLGPTKDDITKHTLARYFQDTLVLNASIVSHIQEMFSKRGIPFSELNRQQGLVPSKCIPLHNALGTASGMWFDENETVFVSLPGVPYEMKGLMVDQVLPKIQKTFTLPYILHKTLITYGMGESAVALRIEAWENQLPEQVRLAYLPSAGKLRLRLSGKGFSKELLTAQIEKEVKRLMPLIADILVGLEDTQNIEVVVSQLLREKAMTLAVAESCTGGRISSLLTANPGASDFFVGGLVAYTAALKTKELNVSEQLIAMHSVVSPQVAEAMALGVRQKMNSDFAIATTGNAGPSADQTDKEVGSVCIAIATPKGVFSEEFNFGSPREKVVQRSSFKALEMLRKEILKNY